MTVGRTVLQEHQDHGSFFRCQTAPWKYSYMLGGMVSLCSLAMCLRTISEYRKRSPQMRQCHWSRAKMYGRHSELFGSSLGSGILIFSRGRAPRRNHNPKSTISVGCAAEQRDERATPHSITSSASASRFAGTLRPSALAVLRLMASSNVVGRWTGRSAGFSPLRMRST
jgi:hypothetical protein